MNSDNGLTVSLIAVAVSWLNSKAEQILIELGGSDIDAKQAKEMRLDARRHINAASCLVAIRPGTELRNVALLWRVPSERNPAEFYLAGPNTCNCTGGLNGHQCKHMAAAVALSHAQDAIRVAAMGLVSESFHQEDNANIWRVGVLNAAEVTAIEM